MNYHELVQDHVDNLKLMLSTYPPCREIALAITKLEECYLWVTQAITMAEKRHQDQIIADSMKSKEKEKTQCSKA